jgi:hypothetical protein
MLVGSEMKAGGQHHKVTVVRRVWTVGQTHQEAPVRIQSGRAANRLVSFKNYSGLYCGVSRWSEPEEDKDHPGA